MNFRDFFNMGAENVKRNCIICNEFDIGLFSNDIKKGLFVKTANFENCSVIALKNNFLAGDAVLYLKETQCENVMLFGSCGGCANIEIGDLVLIEKAYNFESFSDMATSNRHWTGIEASKEIFEEFYRQNRDERIIRTNSAACASLILEKKFLGFFKENNISALDMESSIIFCAAKEIGVKFGAVMYVSDHIENKPFGSVLDMKNKMELSQARKRLAKMIARFFK
jgi:purine-nucleoside phosphorylase